MLPSIFWIFLSIYPNKYLKNMNLEHLKTIKLPASPTHLVTKQFFTFYLISLDSDCLESSDKFLFVAFYNSDKPIYFWKLMHAVYNLKLFLNCSKSIQTTISVQRCKDDTINPNFLDMYFSCIYLYVAYLFWIKKHFCIFLTIE